MILGIDASNIRTGGGVIHLKEILNHAPFEVYNISRIVVWGEMDTLQHLPEHERVIKIILPKLNGSLLKRFFWQLNKLSKEASALGCNVLLIPGGIYLGRFRPFVSIIQNMQVFEWAELRREGVSREGARLLLLQALQALTCFRSSGLIFLSFYCLRYFKEKWRWLIRNAETIIIQHGINNSNYKKTHKPIDLYSNENPFHILYVSTVKNYKHQWNLIDAVGRLRGRGHPLHLHLVGGGDRSAIEKLQKAAERNQKTDDFVFYHGSQTHETTLHFYSKADLFAFPSSCEAFGISLLEAMSYGLPIACSKYGPMPEVLGEAGLFFDPLDVNSIAEALEKLLLDVSLRKRLSTAAQERAKLYSWQASARDTFGFLYTIWKRT